jgi:transposase
VFHWWHRVREGTLTQSSLARYMRPIRYEVGRWLEAGQPCGGAITEDTCREILKVREALWTFVRDAGVEPTNNVGGRAIRPGVLWHKGSLVIQSPQGARFIDTLMTVVATLKQQHRNGLDYVTAACKAALRGEPALFLLPAANDLKRLMPVAV